MRRRRTDYGTIILHWLLVAAIGAAFLSGLRIATEAPGRSWTNLFDFMLPRVSVWTLHIQAAVLLIAISLAYTVYLRRSGLSRRILFDRVRLRGLIGRKHARLAAVSVLLTWGFFAAMLTLIVSGGFLYFGWFAGYDVVTAHWLTTWAIPAFAGLHILVHYMIGGTSQLFRIFRPECLPPPPPRLDAVELLTLLVEQSASLTPEASSASTASQPTRASLQGDGKASGVGKNPASGVARPQDGSRRKSVTLQSNPLIVATAAAIVGASFMVASDWVSVDSLEIHRIASADAPILDGDTSDPVWRNIRPFSLTTNHGGNFDGTGVSKVEIRAVHDGTWAYFLFIWQDPTRSLKQLPLIKKIEGWHLLHRGYEHGDEYAFNEDKFAVLLTTLNVSLAGDRTFHASPHPIPGAPSTMTGRGLHFTTAAGVYADVWQWKATSDATGRCDDDYFGPPRAPTVLQVRHIVPYRGGFGHDPGAANYSNNSTAAPNKIAGDKIVEPRRLSKDLAATQAAMGPINLDPDIGESARARWFMTKAESVPYSPELDRRIPIGTVIPGVIIAGKFSGDRADVRCAARWASGHWALEVARRLDTHSPYDVPIKSGVFMRVAAFDHSQIRHTRHVRPIRLEVE